MFLHRVRVEYRAADGTGRPVPLRQIDNFCMRNFTNDAVFDDTLPLADGLLEVGSLISRRALRDSMDAWFRRKGYLLAEESLHLDDAEPSRIETP